jgi:Protein of unknown function (DUF3047)
LNIGAIARDLAVVARLGARQLVRQLGASAAERAPPDLAAWRQELEAWVRTVPVELLAEHRFIELPATRPPWFDTGLQIAAGDMITWFAAGRVYLSRALDIWVPPSFQLWARVGAAGTVLRGTRDTHSFQSAADGPLQLASYFPGEWSTPQGDLGHGAHDYGTVSGGMVVLLLKWRAGVEPAAVLRETEKHTPLPTPVAAEASRLAAILPAPAGWDYLWYVGPGELYRAGSTPDRQPSVCCDTRGDAGILQHPAALPLLPGTFLSWRWCVDSLPLDLREDSMPSHDYLSIAVEFDDGKDLTYLWSATLPVGTVFRCPLPAWKDKETHVVVRSGSAELGCWLDERRDVHEDYRRCIGGPARSVVRVWLIAISLFQRGHGRCEYSGIEFEQPDGHRLKVL